MQKVDWPCSTAAESPCDRLLGDEESLEFSDPCTVIMVTRGSQGVGTSPGARLVKSETDTSSVCRS
jgi:hypothetical protein